jgi:hypothetical protein
MKFGGVLGSCTCDANAMSVVPRGTGGETLVAEAGGISCKTHSVALHACPNPAGACQVTKRWAG